MRKTNLERFNEKWVIQENNCWVWTGGLNKDGYGKFWTGFTGENGSPITELAHRWVFLELKEPLEKGNYVLHKCDNPSCVNPDHLFQGTQRKNMSDCVEKNRHPQIIKVLSDEEVLEIKARYTGRYGEIKELAKEYEAISTAVSRILSNSPKNYGRHSQSLRWRQRQAAIDRKES